MNFYQASSVTTALTLPTTYSVANGPAVSLDGWKYLNCVSEPFLSGQGYYRALDGINTASSTMSLEKCSTFCAGYQYFGVEYSEGKSETCTMHGTWS